MSDGDREILRITTDDLPPERNQGQNMRVEVPPMQQGQPLRITEEDLSPADTGASRRPGSVAVDRGDIGEIASRAKSAVGGAVDVVRGWLDQLGSRPGTDPGVDGGTVSHRVPEVARPAESAARIRPVIEAARAPESESEKQIRELLDGSDWDKKWDTILFRGVNNKVDSNSRTINVSSGLADEHLYYTENNKKPDGNMGTEVGLQVYRKDGNVYYNHQIPRRDGATGYAKYVYRRDRGIFKISPTDDETALDVGSIEMIDAAEFISETLRNAIDQAYEIASKS